MWFRKKIRNRRLGRSHVLDVKLRTSQVRLTRWRAVIRGCFLLFALLLGVYVVWRCCDWGLNRFLYQNDTFSIRKLEIQTDGTLTLDRIRRWSGVKSRDNLLALDMARIRRNLELVPLIQTASVQRVFPDTLQIKVVERDPLAQVYIPFQPRAFGGGHEPALYFLDPTGCVIPDISDANAPSLELPTLVGVNSNELRPGRPVESPQIQAALRFLQFFGVSPMAGLVEVQRIDVSHPETLHAVTDQNSTIILSVYKVEEQLRRWRAIHDFGMSRGLVISNLDLSVGNNIPALWFERGAAPPPKPKNPKSTAKRKKHV